jgi:hypothetical protein
MIHGSRHWVLNLRTFPLPFAAGPSGHPASRGQDLRELPGLVQVPHQEAQRAAIHAGERADLDGADRALAVHLGGGGQHPLHARVPRLHLPLREWFARFQLLLHSCRELPKEAVKWRINARPTDVCERPTSLLQYPSQEFTLQKSCEPASVDSA